MAYWQESTNLTKDDLHVFVGCALKKKPVGSGWVIREEWWPFEDTQTDRPVVSSADKAESTTRARMRVAGLIFLKTLLLLHKWRKQSVKEMNFLFKTEKNWRLQIWFSIPHKLWKETDNILCEWAIEQGSGENAEGVLCVCIQTIFFLVPCPLRLGATRGNNIRLA